MRLLVLLAVIFSGCMMGHGGHGDLPAAPTLLRPDPPIDLPEPAIAADMNPDPGVVEVDLRAAPAEHAYLAGKPTWVWAFNGSIPGPTIEAKKGDQVIVHFRNDLPEPTTIHWHGLRVPNDMDGAGRLSAPIPPGRTFDYRFVVPDAGTFWYHPHVRSDVQVDKGLYGAIVVRDPDEPALGISGEQMLVLDDVLVDPATGAFDDRLGMRGMMMGREGNLVLVNGQRAGGTREVVRGERVRLRVVNTANSRFFKIQLQGGSLVQIGSDGGLIPAPRPVDTLLLVPGERVDLLVETQAGATLKALPHERGIGAGASEDIELARFHVSEAPEVTPPALPSALRAIDVLQPAPGTHSVRLGERMAHHGWQFTINDQVFPHVPLVDSTLGSHALWALVNESDMDHPFHLHGFVFQRRGVPEWKDTIDVPARSTVELVVDFADRPGAAGDWLYHCHILEHAEAGMMGEARVR